MPYEYVFETGEFRRQRLIVLGTALVLVIASIIVALFIAPPGEIIKKMTAMFTGAERLNVAGLFLASFIGGLFFIPLPQEVFFYTSVRNGTPPLGAFIGVIGGYLASQAVNYALGSSLSIYARHIVPTKKLYEVRRSVNKWGGWAIFLSNIIPAPAPLLTFAVGITRFNTTRLAISLVSSNIIKYAIIWAFIIVTT